MAANFDRTLEIAHSIENTIRSDLDTLNSSSYNPNLMSRVETQLKDFQTKIGQLKGQLNGLNSDDREMYAQDVSDLESCLNQFLYQLNQIKAKTKSQQQHQENMQKGQQALNNFDEALAIGNDTLATQQNTMNTLNQDRESLERIDQNLTSIECEAEKGFNIGGRMIRRQCCYRIISWFIVFVLLVVFIASLAYVISKKNKKDD